jgi:hypothetical protein
MEGVGQRETRRAPAAGTEWFELVRSPQRTYSLKSLYLDINLGPERYWLPWWIFMLIRSHRVITQKRGAWSRRFGSQIGWLEPSQ